MKKEEYTKLQAVISIIGEIDSVGETYTDDKRYDNLLDFEKIIYELIRELTHESNKINNYQYSMKRSGKKSLEIIREIFYMVDYLVKSSEENQ